MTRADKYRSIFSDLEDSVNILIFFKKDGTLRIMLATRDILTAGLCLGDSLAGKLNSHSNRCNINNNNIAVIDLLVGDVRSFNVDRLIRHVYLGQCATMEQFDKYCEVFNKISKMFESIDTVITLDNLDIDTEVIRIANEINEAELLELVGRDTINSSSCSESGNDTKGSSTNNANGYISYENLGI